MKARGHMWAIALLIYALAFGVGIALIVMVIIRLRG
jgi:hypothetical protein